MKVLLKTLCYLFLIMLLGFIILYLVAFTKPGLEWSLKIIQRYISPSLKIENSEGVLSKKFTLYNVTYIHKNIIVKIGKMDCYWNPYYLFRNKLFIYSADIKNLALLINKNSTNEHFELSRYKNLYKKIILNNIKIDEINIYYHSKLKTHIANFEISTLPNIKKFSFETKQGALSGYYSLLLSDKWYWVVQATGNNVDTHSLWSDSNSTVSFKLFSKGQAFNNIENAILQVTNLHGYVLQFPLLGTIQIRHDTQRTTSDIDLAIGKAFLKVTGDIGEKSHLDWVMQLPKLENIYPLLKGSIYSKGVLISNQGIPFIKAELQANNLKFKNMAIDAINGHAFYDFSDVKLNLIGKKITISKYTIPEVKVSSLIKYGNDQITTLSKLVSQDKNSANVSLNFSNISHHNFKDIPLTGNATFSVTDINKLVKLDRIKSLYGSIVGNVKLNGTVSKLKYLGNVNLWNGQFSIPELGIFLHDINLHAEASQLSFIKIDGDLISNQGKAFIKGVGNLENPNYPVRITIKGNQLQVANTREYKIIANPDLLVSIDGENAAVTGKIIFPYININFPQYNEIVNLPSEFEFVGKKSKPRYFKNLALRINFEIENEAYLLYKDLSAYLTGQVFVYQVPGGLPSGKGILLIKHGTYRVYDKQFGINDGRLIYVGNLLTNPGLNIRAMKQASYPATNFMGFKYDSPDADMNVGVSVTGTLLHPTVEFISNPPMNQDDILAHILFGQSRANISGFDALSLLGTLTTSLDIQGPTQGNQPPTNSGFASIFKIGFFNPVQTLNFSLPLSKNWRIKTETNPNEVGIDLHYYYDSKS